MSAEDLDELYLKLLGARERLCRAQVLCAAHANPVAARERLELAIEHVDGVGAFLPQWSVRNMPEIAEP